MQQTTLKGSLIQLLKSFERRFGFYVSNVSEAFVKARSRVNGKVHLATISTSKLNLCSPSDYSF